MTIPDRVLFSLCVITMFALMMWALVPQDFHEPREYAEILADWGNGKLPTRSFRVGQYYYEAGEDATMVTQHAGTPIDWMYVEEKK